MGISKWPAWALEELTGDIINRGNQPSAIRCKYWVPEEKSKGKGYCHQFKDSYNYNSAHCEIYCEKFEERELFEPLSIWDIILSNKGRS